MNTTEPIKLKPCCALCEYLWDQSNCPLYNIYNSALEYGGYNFNDNAKYITICDEFDLETRFKPIES